MSDLLREVDEMMRQERLEKFWRENGNYIIGFIVLSILLTAGITGWKNWQYQKRTTETEQLIAALDDDNYAEQADEISADLGKGIKAVALLTAAGKALEGGDQETAQGYYQQIAADKAASGDLYGLGVIMSARLAEEDGKAAYLSDLQKVAGDQGSPWRYHAFVEAALLEVSLNRDYEQARRYLKNVIDAAASGSSVPDSLVQRAQSLDHVYGLQHNAGASAAGQEG